MSTKRYSRIVCAEGFPLSVQASLNPTPRQPRPFQCAVEKMKGERDASSVLMKAKETLGTLQSIQKVVQSLLTAKTINVQKNKVEIMHAEKALREASDLLKKAKPWF